MNLLQRAVVKTLTALRAYPSPQPLTWEALERELAGYRRENLAGVSVNEYTSLHYSPIWCGVSTLSRDIAKLPLILYKNLPNGGKERFTSHRLYRILHDEWNPEMTSYKARETMQALCVLYGNSYAEIVRDELGRPAGMYPIVPTRVTPIRDDVTGNLLYRVMQPRGGQKLMRPINMIHLSALSTDGIIGHALSEHACESIGLGLATEKFGAAFFGNGATFGGVVQAPQLLDAKQKDDIRTAIEAIHRGVERAHKVLVLGGGATFTARGTSPNEGQYIETRKFQIAEVARWLGMPNHKLGDLENAHFTNIEEQELQYYVGTVSGWLEMWEQELSRKLIAPLEYSQQTIEHKLEGVLRGDSTKRADFYTKMWNIGAFSQNDILRLENQNPIGPAGDVHMVPLNMIPVERYGEWIDAQLKAKTAPPAPKALPATKTQGTVAALKRALLEAQAKADALVATAVEAAQKAGDSAEWRAMAEQAKAEAATAARDVLEARDLLRLATEQRDAILAERQAETAARELAERTAAALQSKAEQLEVAELQAHEALTVAEETVATQRTALDLADQRASDLAQDIASARAQAAETATRATSAESTHVELSARVAALTTADTALEQAQLKLAALETTAQAQRAAELDRLSGVVTAHRALIVDVIQRAIRPEVERARRHQKSPESLQRWAEAFYQTHRDVCADLFWPAVLTHLAWKRSTEDAREVARALAREHCDESERQIRVVIEGSDPEEFHAQLERTLARWEQERPTSVADKILAEEIGYIRSIS